MILNLDKDFSPLEKSNLELIEYDSFNFSDGTYHIKIKNAESLNTDKLIHITFRGEEILKVLIAVDALKRIGFKEINLVMPFYLGARQDRVMIKGEALTSKIYADLINMMQLNEVLIFDPHSEVTPALLNNCKVIDNYRFIEQVIQQIDEDIILISVYQ